MQRPVVISKSTKGSNDATNSFLLRLIRLGYFTSKAQPACNEIPTATAHQELGKLVRKTTIHGISHLLLIRGEYTLDRGNNPSTECIEDPGSRRGCVPLCLFLTR